MREKTYLFAFVLLMSIVMTACGKTGADTDNNDRNVQSIESSYADEDDAALDDMSEVDEILAELSERDEFINGNDTERYNLLYETLSELQSEGRISGLSYNEEKQMFSFTYAYGALGGWSLHPNEFDPMMN